MWLIPSTSRFCRYAPATEVSNSDWPAHWRTLLESLQWRSKPTPWRTWLLRLRRVSWLSKLCGRICEPSRRSDFEDALISSLRAIRASHSRSRAKEKVRTIPDTFGRILLESSRQYNLFGASSRTSPDTLVSDFPMFIAAYEIWVTQLRRDYLARQSAERPTNGNGCSSWPTIQTADAKQAKSNKRGNPHLNRSVGLLDRYSLNTTGKNPALWATPNIPDRGGAGGQHSDLSTDLKCRPRELNPAWVEQLQGLPVMWTDLGSWGTG